MKAITNNVTGFFSWIVDSVKSTLGIKSPSKMYAQIGRYTCEFICDYVEWMLDNIEEIKERINNESNTNT